MPVREVVEMKNVKRPWSKPELLALIRNKNGSDVMNVFSGLYCFRHFQRKRLLVSDY